MKEEEKSEWTTIENDILVHVANYNISGSNIVVVIVDRISNSKFQISDIDLGIKHLDIRIPNIYYLSEIEY